MISGTTKILGVIGHPVEHTSSPAMHNAAIQALGLDYVYTAFHVEPQGLPRAIDGMRGLNIAGLNVTVPHKGAVMEYLDEISPEAQAIGAVNTIANNNGRLTGYNTDGYGILESLRREGGLEKLPAHVALLGAGGAARAILYALLQRPEVESIALLNRTVERAQQLAGDLDTAAAKTQAGPLDTGAQAIGRAGLLINSTSVGMHPYQDHSPLPDPACLHRDMLVLDIVYNPLRTRLMEQAEAAGARALNGLGMLAFQGARAFAIWTGQEPPVEAMLKAALARFGKH
ncbi:MAG: shikimate dehydrogenase [Candidatus Latescibacteria bacterium]|nr:shikimate dehydrogenase [Candidatus Latescibacterota bacterium]